jgi:dienelactone hydrolase
MAVSEINAECGQEIRASAIPVIRQPLDNDRLVATLFRPIAPGPHRTVIVLQGSLGGRLEGSAAVLASQGFAALALAYFGADPLPRELVEIPLEYFAEAIAWLKAQASVDPDRIAVMGVSKGGELALLLAATYPQDIKAVVAYSASSVVWRGASYRPGAYLWGSAKSSWTLAGKPVPFVNVRPTLPEVLGVFIGKVPSLRAMHERSLCDAAAVSAASIAVEKINGPVLLISHSDDRVWPAVRLSELAMTRLAAHNHPFAYEHLSYAGAGHPMGLPYSAPDVTTLGPWPLGGSLEANGHASADSWTKAVDFLVRHLERDWRSMRSSTNRT